MELAFRAALCIFHRWHKSYQGMQECLCAGIMLKRIGETPCQGPTYNEVNGQLWG
jgi:hypothetical protein